MKQTAVEWLIDYLKNIKELPFIRQNLNMNEQNILNDIIEQAKQMEKEQIMEAYMKAKLEHIDTFGLNVMKNKIINDTEKYYNETYKTDKE
jgi:hypothetical protein